MVAAPLRIAAALCVLGTIELGAQSLPRLEPLPVTPMLQALDYRADGGLAIDRAGCLILYNSDAHSLTCIDPRNGAFRSVGREGSGPSEFRLVTSMVAASDGGAIVYDAGNARFALLSSGWRVTATVPHTPVLALLGTPRDSVLALTLPAATASDLVAISLRTKVVTRRFSPSDVDSLKRFVDPAVQNGPWAKSIVPRRAGGWFIPAQREYVVFVADAKGVKQRQFGRPELPPELPNAQEKEAIEAQFTRNTANVTPEVKKSVRQIFDQMLRRPKAAMVVGAMAEDAQSRVWVGTTRIRNDSSEVDVFNAAGKYLSTVRLPGKIQRLLIQGDELFALYEWLGSAREGMQGVGRYRVR
ncbi:MAG: hypothetical protein V4558_08950 [Gemmatimonadota bacterium]